MNNSIPILPKPNCILIELKTIEEVEVEKKKKGLILPNQDGISPILTSSKKTIDPLESIMNESWPIVAIGENILKQQENDGVRGFQVGDRIIFKMFFEMHQDGSKQIRPQTEYNLYDYFGRNFASINQDDIACIVNEDFIKQWEIDNPKEDKVKPIVTV